MFRRRPLLRPAGRLCLPGWLLALFAAPLLAQPASDRPSYHWNGFPTTHNNPDAVSAASVSAARMRSRFALLTGLKDSNLTSTRDLDRAMRADGFKARLIVEPELGHAVGNEDSMRQALEFLLGPTPVPGAGG